MILKLTAVDPIGREQGLVGLDVVGVVWPSQGDLDRGIGALVRLQGEPCGIDSGYSVRESADDIFALLTRSESVPLSSSTRGAFDSIGTVVHGTILRAIMVAHRIPPVDGALLPCSYFAGSGGGILIPGGTICKNCRWVENDHAIAQRVREVLW